MTDEGEGVVRSNISTRSGRSLRRTVTVAAESSNQQIRAYRNASYFSPRGYIEIGTRGGGEIHANDVEKNLNKGKEWWSRT